jgi:hypothetical protein
MKMGEEKDKMNKIKLLSLSAIVIIALCLSILPALASDSPDGMKNGKEGNTSIMRSAVQSEYPVLTTRVGEALTFTLSAADPDNDTMSYAASNLPAGATFNPLTGTFSWTPGYDQAGTYPDIHFEVSDGALTDSENITITVINLNRPPVLNGIGNKSVIEQKPLEFTVSAADSDNDTLIYSASNLPPGAIFNAQTRTFSWTPNSGQQGTYAGVHFAVSDGILADAEDITVTVTAGSSSNTTIGEAVFSVSALNINPLKVSTGKKVNISALATNSGTAAGTYEVTLKINGSVQSTKTVTIAAGASVTVSFTTQKNVAGVYMVDVNGLTGSFTVSADNSHGGRH